MTEPSPEPTGRPHAELSAPSTLEESDDVEAEVEARAADRVVTFYDAVIAIAITLLALDLPVPPGDLTNSQFLHTLRDDWDAYLAFLVSFMVIASHWSTHRRVFRYVARFNRRLFRLNMVWLLMMILTPWATRIVYGGGQLGVRFTVYALIQVIATGCTMLMIREIQLRHLLRRDAPEQARHADLVRSVSIMLAFLVSIPVAYAAGSWAFALWALAPRIGYVLRRFNVDRRLTASDSN